ncbi:MAG: hypothetical protein ETSY1_45030 [Candidatus Entotheonella factor]|uniref:Uncharacterized protein n=1 Tax=Entotheonella factor TaxID=1429438 RepID=W4L370_ENTF1|nr:MAG: hypothetical protein ETSY1_45030 [Candidatus Entotheonella factor]
MRKNRLRLPLKRASTEQVMNRYLQEMRGYMEPVGLKFPPMALFEAEKVELLPSTRDILLSLPS